MHKLLELILFNLNLGNYLLFHPAALDILELMAA